MIDRTIFVDTNVFVYARQPEEKLKQPIAQDWLDRLWVERRGRTSIQVLNECYSTLTRKVNPRHPSSEVWLYVACLMAWQPCPVDASLVLKAHMFEARYRFNWWNCLLLAAAQRQRCAILLTEELDNGGIYGGVRICNPFQLAVSDVA
jgi:predicted nucleic acid-binding protein